MPMNRVQFQPGMSLREFQTRFGTDEQCRQALREARWPYGFRCPSCEGAEHSRFERHGRSYWQCNACRAPTSLTAGTIFDASKLPLTVWLLGMYLLTQTKTGMSALELHRHLGVSYRTAWLVKHKLMAVMFEQERDRRLEGIVQIDDAFLGAERSGGKRGRGSENKGPLIAAVQTTGDGQAICARLDVLPDWKVPTVARWAVKALMPSTHVVSDGLASFVGVKSAACSDEPIIHDSGTPKANVQHARFTAINTLLRQPEDVDEHHLPRLQDRALRHALHGRVPVPVQPSLRPGQADAIVVGVLRIPASSYRNRHPHRNAG